MKLLITLLFVLSISELHAQTFEISAQANGGFSHYAGKSTVNNTFLNAGDPANHSGYANGDGNSPAFTYGADVQLQYTFKFNLIMGVQTGYEVISSHTNINGVYDGANGEVTATGYTSDHYGYININPYLGFRFHINNVRLDLLPGLDISLGESTKSTVDVKATDGTYYNKPTNNINNTGDEFRVRFGLAAYYKKFGITASHSRGINHFAQFADAYIPPEHMEVFRLGISYKIN